MPIQRMKRTENITFWPRELSRASNSPYIPRLVPQSRLCPICTGIRLSVATDRLCQCHLQSTSADLAASDFLSRQTYVRRGPVKGHPPDDASSTAYHRKGFQT